MKRITLAALAALGFGLYACGGDPQQTDPNQNPAGGGDAGCTDTAPSTVSCKQHSECAMTGTCHENGAVCDLSKSTCTADAIHFASDSDVAPTAISLTCYGQTGFWKTAPATVTLVGCVKPFGVEASTTGLDVTLYNTGDYATPIATTKSVDPATLGITCATALHGAYKLTGVPTGKRLVAKVSGDPVNYHPTWRFNVTFNGADADTTGTIKGQRAELSVISDTTWKTFPQLMGLSKGIDPANGAIAGGVEDCDQQSLAGGLVTFDKLPSQSKFSYMNESIDSPKPSTKRKATNVNGLFAVINVPPGPVSMSAVIPSNGETVDLGTRQGEVFAGSVTILSFRGPLP